MQTKKIIIAAIISLSVLASSARGQIVYQQPGSSALKFHYNNWTLEDPSGTEYSILQRTLTLTGFVPIRENFEARYYMAQGYNRLDYVGEEMDISGLGDLRVQFSHSFIKDQVLLSAGINLPTGKKGLDPITDRTIIEFLSFDFLSLPMRRYGEGLGFNLQAGGAKEAGRFKLGLSAVYDYCGKYEPYSDGGDYDPGDAISANATARTKLKKFDCSADIGFSVFGTDRLDGDDIYKQGSNFNARLMATYPADKYSATFGIRMIIRGRNKRYSVTDGVIDSQLKKYGDEFDSFLRVAYNFGKGSQLAGLVGMRQILESEEYLGKSSVYHFGADLSRSLSDNVSFDVGAIYHIGSTDYNDIDISGIQFSGGLRVSY